MRVLTAISFAFAALVGACSVANPNHCANLEGSATCLTQSEDTPYCNKCLADNNGCVADRADSICDAGSTSLAETTTTTNPTTTGSSSTTSTTDSSTLSSTTTAPTTTTGSSTTTGTPDATTTTGTTDATTTTGTTDTSTSDTSTDTTEGTSTGDTTLDLTTGTTTGSTTMVGPMCGNDVQEGTEICDGNDLNGFNCKTSNPNKFNGGTLHCSLQCNSYDDTECCLSSGQDCGGVQSCCAPFTCKGLLPPKCG